MPGVAEYENVGGILRPRPPTPDMCAGFASAAAGGNGIPTGVAVVGGLGAAALLYFLLA